MKKAVRAAEAHMHTPPWEWMEINQHLQAEKETASDGYGKPSLGSQHCKTEARRCL